MSKQFGTAGPRVLYPDVCTSLSLARCSVRAQLLFDRLLVQVDDQGRMLGDPKQVQAKCVPLIPRFSAKAVAKALRELAIAGSILLYVVDDHQFVQLTHWWDFQCGMRRVYPSRWPAPPDWNDGVYGLPGSGKPEGKPAGARFGLRQSASKVPASSPQSAGNSPAECVPSSDPTQIPIRSEGDPDPIRSQASSDGLPAGRSPTGDDMIPAIGADLKEKVISILKRFKGSPLDLEASVNACSMALREGCTFFSVSRALGDMADQVRRGNVPVDFQEVLLGSARNYDQRRGDEPSS